jgi:hypothetical protein
LRRGACDVIVRLVIDGVAHDIVCTHDVQEIADLTSKVGVMTIIGRIDG